MAHGSKMVVARAHNLRFVAQLALLSVAPCAEIGTLAYSIPVLAQTPIAVAPDLPADAETKLAIGNMVRQDVMRLRTPGSFSPSEPSTLGDYLISLQQLFRLTPPAHPANFTDVPPTSPYYAAAQAAVPYLNRQAMCVGCALSTNLYPEQPLTRAQSTVALVGILNARSALPLLDDARTNQVLEGVEVPRHFSPLARRLVATAISGGIISLSTAHSADLTSIETRASTAVILNRTQTKFQVPEIQH